MHTPEPADQTIQIRGVDVPRIRKIIDGIEDDGYISPNLVHELLQSAGIPPFLSL